VILFVQNNNAAKLIDTEAGEYHFCSYCELDETCGKKGLPKILPSNYRIMKYAKMHLDRNFQYPFPGSWENQPVSFNYMLEVAKSEFITQEKLKKEAEAEAEANNGSNQ
jgi:hypothetical protein